MIWCSVWALWKPVAFVLHLQALHRYQSPWAPLSGPEFDSQFLWAQVFVLPRRCVRAKRRRREGLNKARFVPAPPSMAQRDPRTKLHINLHPARELLGYRTPTNSHQSPQLLKTVRRKRTGIQGTRDHNTQISQNSSDCSVATTTGVRQQHGFLKLAIQPKSNNVWSRCGLRPSPLSCTKK